MGDQPVLWREARQPGVGSRGLRILATLAMIVMVVWLLATWGRRDLEGLAFMVSIFGTVLAVFAAAGATGGAISGERQARTLGVLLSSRVRPGAIVLGKAAGGMVRLWFVPALVVGTLAVLSMLRLSTPPGLLLLTPVLAGTSWLLCCTGVLLSAAMTKPSTAASYNTLGALGVWAGLPMMLGIIEGMLRVAGGAGLETLVRGLLLINPVFLAYGTAELGRPRGGRNVDMPGGDMSAEGFVVVVAAYTLACGVLGAGALWWASRGLGRWHAGREG